MTTDAVATRLRPPFFASYSAVSAARNSAAPIASSVNGMLSPACASNVRVAYVGTGQMHGHLEQRMHQLGVAHAVRLLGHMEGPPLTRLLRAAEALVLPSRYRVPFDDAVIDLATLTGAPWLASR